jgi:hypothetical protein
VFVPEAVEQIDIGMLIFSFFYFCLYFTVNMLS